MGSDNKSNKPWSDNELNILRVIAGSRGVVVPELRAVIKTSFPRIEQLLAEVKREQSFRRRLRASEKEGKVIDL